MSRTIDESKLKPVSNRVVIRPDPKEKEQNGVIMPSSVVAKTKQLTGKVIAVTDNSPCNIDEQLELDAHLFTLTQGNKIAEIQSIKDVRYVLGVAASSGYREYKRTGDYENDILAFVCIPV